MGKVATNDGVRSWDMNMEILSVDNLERHSKTHSHTPTLRMILEWLFLLWNYLFIYIPPLSCDLLKVRG